MIHSITKRTIVGFVVVFLSSTTLARDQTQNASEKIRLEPLGTLFGLESLGLGYEYIGRYSHQLQLVNGILSVNDSKRTKVELNLFPIMWTTEDKFNAGKFNLTIPVLPYLVGILGKVEESSGNVITINWVSILASVLNIHMYYLLHNSPFDDEKRYGNHLSLALFIRNGTAAYLFQRNKWISFFPGVGLSLFYNKLQFSIGYHISYQTDLSKVYNTPSLYISLRRIGLFYFFTGR